MWGNIGDGLGDLITFLVSVCAFLFLMCVASLFVVGFALSSVWSPWYLLIYPAATALFVALRLTILSID